MHKLCSQLTTVFRNLVAEASTPVRLWIGEVEVINPETQQPTGAYRKTMNLDFVVPKSVYDKAVEWTNLPKDEKNGWVEIEIFNKRLVMVSARENKARGQLIVQFAVPNNSNWVEIGTSEFKEAFSRLYSEANTISKESRTESKPKNANPKVDAAETTDNEFERLMNS